MRDPQMMTLAPAIVIPLSMLIYSNSGITQAKETLRAEIGHLKSDLTLTMESRFNSSTASWTKSRASQGSNSVPTEHERI
jgi:hypothetical protein